MRSGGFQGDSLAGGTSLLLTNCIAPDQSTGDHQPFAVHLLLHRALMQQTTGVTPTDKDAASWMWEGMGTDGAAVRVPGLSGVRAVQLGSAHVLALLD